MNEEYFGDCGLGLLEYVMEIPWAEMGRVTMDMIQAVSGIGVVVIGLTALTASGGALGGAAAALLAGNAVNLSGIAGTLATFLCGLGNVTMGTADFMQGAADLIRALQNDPEHAGHMIIDKLQLFQDHPWAYALLETAMTMGASYGKHLIQSGKMPVVDQKATGIWEKANSGLLAESSKSGSNTKTLFRGDRASVVPDDVFQNGFKPKGTHNDALLHTKSNTTAGNFVSTSGDKAIATEFAGKNGYVYVIQTDNYVDINSTYGAGAYFPEQMEFSIPGGIKPSEIVGAYKKQGGKIIGDFIPNPNFGGN